MKLDNDIAFKSASELVHHIRQKDFSCRDLLEFYSRRIEKLNPTLNCVVNANFDHARAQADSADAKLVAGKNLGPLHLSLIHI